MLVTWASQRQGQRTDGRIFLDPEHLSFDLSGASILSEQLPTVYVEVHIPKC